VTCSPPMTMPTDRPIESIFSSTPREATTAPCAQFRLKRVNRALKSFELALHGRGSAGKSKVARPYRADRVPCMGGQLRCAERSAIQLCAAANGFPSRHRALGILLRSAVWAGNFSAGNFSAGNFSAGNFSAQRCA
jgi:hypothetical protein